MPLALSRAAFRERRNIRLNDQASGETKQHLAPMSNVIHVKQEDQDDDLVCLGTNSAGHPEASPTSNKGPGEKRARKRLFLEAVVVSTWKEIVEERKRKIKPDSGEDKDKIKQEMLKGIKNPKVKVKAGIALSDDTLFDRITRMKCERFEPPISQDIRDVAVSREFLSSIYGGNPQETFPRVGKNFLAQHGLDDFMYPSLDYNPAAPQIPGAPGLFLATSGTATEWPEIQRVITRIAPSAWQYVGQYKLTPTESLTTREWREQSELFRNTWSREVCVKKWGRWVLDRIAARRRFHCLNPTGEQLEAVDRSDDYKDVTAEDVKAAFARGGEKFAIWEMRCVGYDVEFQRNIAERFKTWRPPPRKPRKPRNKKLATAQKAKTGKKRKRPETSGSDIIVLGDDDSDYLSSSWGLDPNVIRA